MFVTPPWKKFTTSCPVNAASRTAIRLSTQVGKRSTLGAPLARMTGESQADSLIRGSHRWQRAVLAAWLGGTPRAARHRLDSNDSVQNSSDCLQSSHARACNEF